MDDFSDWLNLISVTKSPTTVSGYRWELEHWRAAGGKTSDTTADLARYLAARRAGGASESTLKRSIAALRGYFAHARPGDNPAKAIPWPHPKKRRQRTLNDDQALALIASCDTASPKGTRDLALICLMLDSGLRAAEVCRLKLSDVDLKERALAVVIKGGDEKAGVFSAASGRYIADWLVLRSRFALPETKTLFCSVHGETKGRPLTTNGLRVIFRRLGQRAGLDQGLSPHMLRRAFASMALRRGAPTRVVQVAGRWEDESMVTRYTQDLTARDFDRYSPVEGLMRK